MIPSQFDQLHTVRLIVIALIAALLLTTTACSITENKADALSSYRAEMETFFDELQTAQAAIESIDAASDTAQTQLLEQIDAICVSCASIAGVTPPDGYAEVQNKAEHAAAMMGQASSGFHAAFESTDLDQDSYNAAMEYYKSAGNDIQDMIALLQGSSDTN